MHFAAEQNGLTLIRAYGDLPLEELARIAAAAVRGRAAGRLVVVDVAHVSHLHYAGAALLRSVPGIRLAGASRYVRDLVRAGGAGGFVEFHDGVDEAVTAA